MSGESGGQGWGSRRKLWAAQLSGLIQCFVAVLVLLHMIGCEDFEGSSSVETNICLQGQCFQVVKHCPPTAIGHCQLGVYAVADTATDAWEAGWEIFALDRAGSTVLFMPVDSLLGIGVIAQSLYPDPVILAPLRQALRGYSGYIHPMCSSAPLWREENDFFILSACQYEKGGGSGLRLEILDKRTIHDYSAAPALTEILLFPEATGLLGRFEDSLSAEVRATWGASTSDTFTFHLRLWPEARSSSYRKALTTWITE